MDQQVENKRFSVIVAAYNVEDYIERALKSVVNQTLKNIEIIVINDCATDSTEEKILKFYNEYDNIVYIKHEKNKRLGAARNTGLSVAKGEYIIFLDGDDYLAEDNVLERIDKLIGKDEIDVTYLGFKIEGDREELVLPTEEICTKTYKAAKDKYPNVWSKCWRRKYLEDLDLKFPEYRLYEDVLFNYKGIMKAKSFRVAEFVVHRYISGRKGSITTKIGVKNLEDTVENLKDLIKIRETDYTEEVDIIIKKELNMCKKRVDDMYKCMYNE